MSYHSVGKNHLRRAAAAPTMTPAAATGYGSSYLHDNHSALVARFGSVAADSRIDVDRNMLAGGDGEASDATTGWTLEGGVGTLTRDTLTKYAGAAALKLTHTGAAAAYRDVEAVPGEQLRIGPMALYGGGGAIAACVSLQNLTTGKYLGTDLVWYAAVHYLAQRTLASWTASAPLTATVESLSACGGDPAPLLRWRIELSAAGTVYFDDMGLWPLFDFVGLFGHDVPSRLVAKLLTSDTGAFGGEETLAATLTPARPVMFAQLGAASAARYVRLKLEGTPASAPSAAELFLARLHQFTDAGGQALGPQVGAQVAAAWSQVRQRSESGSQSVYNRAAWPTRKVTLSWLLRTEAALRQIRDELWIASGGGLEPIVFVGSDRMGSDLCVFGRLQGDLPQSFPDMLGDGNVMTRVETVLEEEGFPSA